MAAPFQSPAPAPTRAVNPYSNTPANIRYVANNYGQPSGAGGTIGNTFSQAWGSVPGYSSNNSPISQAQQIALANLQAQLARSQYQGAFAAGYTGGGGGGGRGGGGGGGGGANPATQALQMQLAQAAAKQYDLDQTQAGQQISNTYTGIENQKQAANQDSATALAKLLATQKEQNYQLTSSDVANGSMQSMAQQHGLSQNAQQYNFGVGDVNNQLGQTMANLNLQYQQNQQNQVNAGTQAGIDKQKLAVQLLNAGWNPSAGGGGAAPQGPSFGTKNAYGYTYTPYGWLPTR